MLKSVVTKRTPFPVTASSPSINIEQKLTVSWTVKGQMYYCYSARVTSNSDKMLTPSTSRCPDFTTLCGV
ncbi:hypothetical protein MLD38_009958 [Melastoma candidum]|uniref:Uncharacterized protein n=1 Tax=Melastoma candidum TaxID=119954 RepID=A0ACB9R1E2_9MYRT|nr:hypothetical protein MLD38_009958 [Melastoma candidum]